MIRREGLQESDPIYKDGKRYELGYNHKGDLASITINDWSYGSITVRACTDEEIIFWNEIVRLRKALIENANLIRHLELDIEEEMSGGNK